MSFNGGTLTQIVGSGDGTGNLALSLTGNTANFSNSQLYLYQNSTTGEDDIEVLVVPEPSTWVLLASGMLALFFIQRRKNGRTQS